MKKIHRLTALMAAAVLLCAAGCGTKEKEKTAGTQSSAPTETASVPEPVSEKEEESSEAPLILESSQKESSVIEFSLDNKRPFDTLEEYLETDSAKEMIGRISGVQDNDVIITSVYPEDDTKLVFQRKMQKDFNMNLTDDFLNNIEDTVENNREVFIDLVNELESCINKKVISVVVRYVDFEDNVVYEREFDNNDLEPVESSSEGDGETSDGSGGESSSDTSKQTSSEASKQASSQSSKQSSSESSKQSS